MDISTELVFILFMVGAVAGWVDAVAGGGGLISVSALLLAGLPPPAAIATNKLQGTFGTFTSASYFLQQGVISLRENAWPLIATCIGAVIGGYALTRFDTAVLNYLVPVLLLLISVYFLFFAGNLDDGRTAKMSSGNFSVYVAPVLGFYDGFFGPGTGSFMATSFVSLRGFDIRKATANAKLLNFASNLAALIYFVFFGQIFWLIGIAMMGGQILGAYLGAKVALNAGAKLIRPITVIMCIAMSISALWKLVFAS